VYFRGLRDEQQQEWEEVLQKEGLVPFIRYPVLCQRCGAAWPEFFRVPDEEWQKYVEPAMRGQVLCRTCYDWIRAAVDAGAAERAAVK